MIKSESVEAVVKNFRKMYLDKAYLKISKKLDHEIDYYYSVPDKSYSKKLLSIVKNSIFKL